METCHIVLCPCPSKPEALRIARTLVEQGLAAAVNTLKLESVYRWHGEVRQGPEFLLMIKSRDKDYESIEREILNMHSYQLPGIVSVPIAKGLDAYLGWIRAGGEG